MLSRLYLGYISVRYRLDLVIFLTENPIRYFRRKYDSNSCRIAFNQIIHVNSSIRKVALNQCCKIYDILYSRGIYKFTTNVQRLQLQLFFFTLRRICSVFQWWMWFVYKILRAFLILLFEANKIDYHMHGLCLQSPPISAFPALLKWGQHFRARIFQKCDSSSTIFFV